MHISAPKRKEYPVSLPYVAVLAIIGLLLFILYYLQPYAVDDNWYRHPMKDFIDNPTFANFISGWKVSLNEHFLHDNIRLLNDFGSVITVVPKWIPSLLLSAASCVTILYGSKLAGVWKRNFSLYCITAALYIVVLPWHENMFTIIFALNYIPTSAILLCIFYYFYNGQIRNEWLAFALGMLCALCHEGFGAYLLSAVVTCMVFSKKYRSSISAALVTGILLGVFILALAPGRIERSAGINDIFFGFTNIHHYRNHILAVYLFIAATLPALLIKEWRRKLDLTLLAAIWAMVLAGIVLWRIFPFGLRLVWFVNLASIIGFIFAVRQIPRLPTDNLFCRIICGAAMCASIVHLALCIPWMMQLDYEARQIKALRTSNPDSTVFYDLTKQWDVPFHLLRKVNFFTITNGGYPDVLPIPTALSDFDPKDTEPLENGYPGAMLYKQHIVLSESRDTVANYDCEFTIDDGYFQTWAWFIPFTTKKGETYTYIRVCDFPMRLKWQNVRYFNVLEEKKPAP